MRNLSGGKLDFSVDYDGGDMLGQLCSSFEKMCRALAESTAKMLRMADERKQLNDIYTHDLRTPLIVLRGYADMLVKSLPDEKVNPEEILEIVNTMYTHIMRLDSFVGSMNRVQNLDSIEINAGEVDLRKFTDMLKETSEMLCAYNNLDCSFNFTAKESLCALTEG